MTERGTGGGAVSPGAEALGPLLSHLENANEPQRYRMLAALLSEIADRSAAGANGHATEVASQIETLNKRIVRAGEEKALLNDSLATTQAELGQKNTLLAAEQERAAKLQKVADDQRARLAELQKEREELEKQLVDRNNALHRAEVETEQFKLKLQRAEMSAGDTSKIDALEQEKTKLAARVQEIGTAMEQLRKEKDDEIERLKGAAGEARAETAGGSDALLKKLWERMARVKPPLLPATAQPNEKAAERLVDSLIEMTRFAHEFDLSVQPYLDRFTKHTPTIKLPWESYKKFDGIEECVQKVLDKTPVGVLKLRLLAFKKWTMAALVGNDSEVESVGSHLEQQLRGPAGMGSDPNATIRNYLKNDGHLLFADAVREARSEKIAEAYGHGM